MSRLGAGIVCGVVCGVLCVVCYVVLCGAVWEGRVSLWRWLWLRQVCKCGDVVVMLWCMLPFFDALLVLY